MNAHSTTGFFVRDLACLKVDEAMRPNRIPIPRDKNERIKKSPPIIATEPPVKA
jgi:hypothetical protein